jgi:hypothetical protein
MDIARHPGSPHRRLRWIYAALGALVALAAIFAATRAFAPAPAVPPRLVLASGGPLDLGKGPASVTLAPASGAAAGAGALRVVLSDLQAKAPPGVLYRVEAASDGHTAVLGYLNFFNAASGGPATFSFALPRTFGGGRPVRVTVSPQGEPQADAAARVGHLFLALS